ncbi:MAG: class I SAM-dependent methyltransferase [Nitrospinaceae bacterium]
METMTSIVDVAENPQTRQTVQNLLAARCRALGTPVAVVGTNSSASLLLAALAQGGAPLAGVFDRDPRPTRFQGCLVQPLEGLRELDPGTTAVIASPTASIQLEETLTRIRKIHAGPVLCLEQLLDLWTLFESLKTPLQYNYGDHILKTWGLILQAEPAAWNYLPPGLDIEGKTVLELGPFEGHFSMMLMQRRPQRVIGLEGRPENYAKAAVLKAYLDWSNYTLRFGDMHLLDSLVPEPVDMIFCSGVHYHSAKPWWFLETCMEKCGSIVLSGHVASTHSPPGRRRREVALDAGVYSFEVFPEGGDPLSGLTPYSLWFQEKDLIHFVESRGFRYEKFNEWVNPHGLWVCSHLTRK